MVHIIVRGFWIGAIGLRYVSGDIDYDELNYSEHFTDFYKKRIGSFDEYIEKLENFSSVLFSFTFLLFFLLFSFFIFNLVFGILIATLIKFNLIDPKPGEPGLEIFIGSVYYLLGLIVLIDFITLGAFKKITDKTVGGIYMWIYRFYSTVSLSFLYRPLLLNFIDNRYTKRLFFLAIPYGLSLILLSGYTLERHEYFPSFSSEQVNYESISESIVNFRYYDDLRDDYVVSLGSLGKRKKKPSIDMISLSQYEVDRSELKFFLEYEERDTRRLDASDESIFAYRKNGLRHNIQNNKAKDGHYDEIIAREMIDINQSFSLGKVDSIDLLLKKKYGDFQGDRIELRERIVESFDNEKSIYANQKSRKIKNAILNLYDIRLNNVQIKDELECKYYIHSNMLEKGLLCYLDIDTLAYGGHMITVIKSGEKKRDIPFRKIKQNQ